MSFASLVLRAASVVACGACFVSAPAYSDIRFDNLTGITGDTFVSAVDTQYGLSKVRATGGNWKKSFSDGAPSPSIFVEDLVGNPFGSLELRQRVNKFSLTDFAGFWFERIDLKSTMGVHYEISGVGLGTISGDLPASSSFISIHTPRANLVDTLRISIVGKGPGSFTFDNLVFGTPEPETYAFMIAGLAIVAGIAQRRARRGARSRGTPGTHYCPVKHGASHGRSSTGAG